MYAFTIIYQCFSPPSPPSPQHLGPCMPVLLCTHVPLHHLHNLWAMFAGATIYLSISPPSPQHLGHSCMYYYVHMYLSTVYTVYTVFTTFGVMYSCSTMYICTTLPSPPSPEHLDHSCLYYYFPKYLSTISTIFGPFMPVLLCTHVPLHLLNSLHNIWGHVSTSTSCLPCMPVLFNFSRYFEACLAKISL